MELRIHQHFITIIPNTSSALQPPTNSSKTLAFDFPQIVLSDDFTPLLSDEILLHILSKHSETSQRNSDRLVSKRWLNLQGRLVRSLKVLDWDFLISGRMFFRFPNLTHIDLLHGTVVSNSSTPNLIVHELGSFHISPDNFLCDDHCLLPIDEVDFGLKLLASVYPNLRRLVALCILNFLLNKARPSNIRCASHGGVWKLLVELLNAHPYKSPSFGFNRKSQFYTFIEPVILLVYDLHSESKETFGNHDDLATCVEYSIETGFGNKEEVIARRHFINPMLRVGPCISGFASTPCTQTRGKVKVVM
ncbi:hypothetical protein L2E82_44986 [Cichorium intybus]|uniref:Uncharacterized protein n=1 Tax=Cichorium intybus TaxID=13427 RepID=A0ACB8ZW61_CICIN|nr:hypothetical protein L2E82_44986 [Cichorium intybus]